MMSKIFKEYFLWFNGKMVDRQVILLINRFSLHYTRINLWQAELLEKLINTKLLFLSTNAISICQPLNQGIIKAWKA